MNTELLSTLVAARKDGAKWATIFDLARAEGVASHTTVELAIMRDQLVNSWGKVPAAVTERYPAEVADSDLPAFVTEAREAKIGWGWIMVLTGRGEAVARGAYTAKTGNHSQGTRTNKGGRHVKDDARFYATSETRVEGFDLDKDQSFKSVDDTTIRTQSLIKKDFAELKALAKECGVRVTAKSTPVTIARAIIKADPMAKI